MTHSSVMQQVRIGFFSKSVVSRIGHERGIFARHLLDVTEDPVASSPAQFRSLLAGEYDMVFTSPDNVAAYRLSDVNPLGARLNVKLLLGLDHGLGLSLIGAPHIRSLDELRGRTVAVDVPSSGFALAMFRVLADAGLRRDEDYELVTLGATPRRREALLTGTCDATLLNAGHDIAAEAAGCHRLARITDSLAPYLGAVLAATDSWLDGHIGIARDFATAWLEATATALDPAQRNWVEPLVADMLGLAPAQAQSAYRMLTSERDGLVPDGRIDPAALRTVLALRSEHGGPHTGIDPDELDDAAANLLDNRLLEGR